MCEKVTFLQTRPPVGEEGEEVGDADVTVAVEVGGAAFARAPTCQEREEIGHADGPVTVKVPQACILTFIRDPVAVLVGETAEKNVADVWDRVTVTPVDPMMLRVVRVEGWSR